jgi:hypothetical protein
MKAILLITDSEVMPEFERTRMWSFAVEEAD